jgi:hypothetical protein
MHMLCQRSQYQNAKFYMMLIWIFWKRSNSKDRKYNSGQQWLGDPGNGWLQKPQGIWQLVALFWMLTVVMVTWLHNLVRTGKVTHAKKLIHVNYGLLRKAAFEKKSVTIVTTNRNFLLTICVATMDHGVTRESILIWLHQEPATGHFPQGGLWRPNYTLFPQGGLWRPNYTLFLRQLHPRALCCPR